MIQAVRTCLLWQQAKASLVSSSRKEMCSNRRVINQKTVLQDYCLTYE